MPRQLTLNLDTNIINAKPILLKEFTSATIYLIGCGGTGSWLTPHLCRLAYYFYQTKKQTLNLKLIDFDTVEERNLLRQNFCHADVGWNKAIALAKRYATIYPYINVRAIDRDVRQIEIEPLNPTIIIGCVDNHLARQHLHKIIESRVKRYYNPNEPNSLWWLDCGNNYSNGQVILGSTTIDTDSWFSPISCLRLPAPSLQCPELLQSELEEEEISCAELQLLGMQSLHINNQIAISAIEMISQLLTSQLKRMRIDIDLQRGTMQSLWITPQNIIDILNKI
jgi:PRTRC genetic system ThiF family protein